MIGPLRSMHLICVQDTLTLLEEVEEVVKSGEAVGAAAEKPLLAVLFQTMVIIPAAFVVNSTVGVRVALSPLGNMTVMVTL